MLRELKMCGGQDNSDHWLAFSCDPVVMGGLLWRNNVSDTPNSKYLVGDKWKDFFFIAFHFVAQAIPIALLIDNKASKLKQAP